MWGLKALHKGALLTPDSNLFLRQRLFLGPLFEFVCIKNQFVLSTPKSLSHLFAIDD